jgi:hypothetical protein
MAACQEAAMSTATFEFSTGAHVPGDLVWRPHIRVQPPPLPRTIAACHRALADCGALYHLFAPGMMAERTTLPVDLGSGPLLQFDGYHLMTELGRVRMALIPGVLAGTYVVAPFGGRGFMSLGVQLDAADFQLALVEGVTWKRTELGRVPHYLPFRQVMPRGHESEATYREYVEFPVPDKGLLTWCAQDHHQQRREGTYVVGWPGVHRTTAGDQAVFIKVIKEPEGLAYMLENERHLRRAASRNPALTAFAPLANVVWTQGVGEIASRIPGDRPGCAVVIERLIKGPTLADLASGLERLEPDGSKRLEPGGSERLKPDGSERLHPRQVAACGRLAGQGLFELNRNAPRGERLLAPDATKGDNLMCQGIAVNAYGEPVPKALVCPDRDHYVSESNPRWRLRGTMFGTDVRSLRRMMADISFDLVEPAHVFQVGRMLLALSTAGAQPEREDDYGPDLDANLEVERRHYARALARFDRQCGAASAPAATALGALIRSCCDPAPERRPSLPGVIDECQLIAGMGG